MMKWCCLGNEKDNAAQKKVGGSLRRSEVFFPLYDHVGANVVQPGVWPDLIQNQPGFRSCHHHLRLSVEDDNIACVDNFGFSSEEYGITHYNRLPGPVTE